MVAFVRGRSGVRRVGHAGTLDPAATGVLPVCLGRATRLIQYLVDARKTYRGTFLLGTETDTYDTTGTVIGTNDASAVSEADIRLALARFEGEIEQTPPAFSALKAGGVPLHRLARAGAPVSPRPRRVSVYKLELCTLDLPHLAVEIECSKGTYVRSLAHDLGRELGVGGCLAGLTRTAVGNFRIEDSVDAERLREEFDSGAWRDRLLAADEVLIEWPAVILSMQNAARVSNGQVPVLASPDDAVRPGRCRAFSVEGDFLAVLRRDADAIWAPEKVFASPAVTV